VRFKSGVFAFVLFIAPASFAGAAPVDCTHLMAWTEAGVSESKLIASAKAQGIAFSLNTETDKNLTSAGASRELL
jgi:hypothetical protein